MHNKSRKDKKINITFDGFNPWIKKFDISWPFIIFPFGVFTITIK